MKHFGLRFLQSLLGVSLLALIVGCNREPDSHRVSGDVQSRLPLATEGGSYHFQEVTLKGITSLYELGGQFAKFYMYPSVTDSKLYGHQPKTRFLKSGAFYIPEDDLSQQMAVIYNHLQNLAAMDEELGVGGVNSWPRDVGVAVRYRKKTGLDYNNAFYDGTIDAILVVPYTRDDLPIAVNAGILAHEHFHSLYYKLVEKDIFEKAVRPLHGEDVRDAVLGIESAETTSEDLTLELAKVETAESYSEEYHKLLSRGLNEGLADFWAWIYTGDPDFLQWSLPSEKEVRTLRLSSEEAASYKFPNMASWAAQMANRRSPIGFDGKRNHCGGDRVAYCLGTEYARTLKRLATVVQSSRGLTVSEARKYVGLQVLKALPLVKENLLKYKTKEFFHPESFFTFLKSQTEAFNDDEKAFLEAIVVNSNKLESVSTTNKASVRVSPEEPRLNATIKPLPIESGGRGPR